MLGMSESDLIGKNRTRTRWTGGDYLVFATVGAFVVAIAATVAARSDGGGGVATVLIVTGGLLFGSWWLIGCAALGVRVALRQRDAERNGTTPAD